MSLIKNLLRGTIIGRGYRKIKRKYRKIKGKIFKVYTLKYLFPKTYNKYKKKPLQGNKVIFVEVRLDHLSNNFQLLYDKLKNDYNMDIHVHYLENVSVGRREYMARCVALMKDMADAPYIFVSDGCHPTSSVDLRKDTTLVQTWHACGAFKKFGFSTADLIFGDTRKGQTKYPSHKNYTYVTVSSKEIVWAYEEAFGLEQKPGIVVPTGTSRTDVFFDETFQTAARKRVEEFFPEAKGKKILLYAPTFRGRVAKAKTPLCFDIEQFAKNFSDEYVLLVKHHFLVKNLPEIPEEYASFAKDCTKELTIEDALSVSDICITDYSSLIFEYSLFERPMLFYAYDLDEYFDWRGFYYDYNELTPGPVCTTNEEMIDYIKNLDQNFDQQKVIDFKEKFMGACDGHCTERIISKVLGNQEETLRKQH